MTALPTRVDRAACVTQFGRWEGPIWKYRYDLARYRRIIRETRPNVIIETGTNTGHSARWFAEHLDNAMVVTIDNDARRWQEAARWSRTAIHRITGSSIDPDVVTGVEAVVEAFGGRAPRVMVSLDSDHSAPHVAEEIRRYGPLVTPGCHLVIEDGVLAWLPEDVQRDHGVLDLYDGTVLDAIEATLPELDAMGFQRDVNIETFEGRATMHPAGWWIKS